MIKTKKTTLCVLLVAVLMFSTSMAVFAASPYETRYNNTVTASSSVSISDSGLLTIANQFQGIREKTTKGEITTYVEKRTLGFFWTRVDIGQPNNQWYDVVYDYMYIGSHSFQLNSHVMRADLYAKGVNAAEEVLPGIKNDLLLGKFKPRETDVAAVARASPEERREKAEQLRVIPEKKPKADKESARSGTKHRQEVYATIDKSYEDMKDSKRVTEDSALVSLRYTARNMVETCDVLFTNFPGLLEKPDYKDQVIEIMQEPKQYILKLEGETDNEQH